MKNYKNFLFKAFCIALFCSTSIIVVAQTDLSKAELINHIYTYDTAGFGLQPLEKLNGLIKNKVRGLGYGGTDILLVVEGETSPVKLSADEAKSFVVNTGGETLQDYALYELKVDKKKRQAFIGRAGMTGVKNGDFAGVISIIKMADGIFQLTLNHQLEKGEYFFVEKSTTVTNNLDVFAFCVQ